MASRPPKPPQPLQYQPKPLPPKWRQQQPPQQQPPPYRPTAAKPRPPSPPPKKYTKPQRGSYGLPIFGVFAFAFGFYGLFAWEALSSLEPPRNHSVPADVADRYDRLAPDFDSDVGLTELLTGILWRRRQMAKRARGDVLEVSCGTGRNGGFYRLGQCRSITFLDRSGRMMEVAREKWRKAHPAWGGVRWVVQSALEPLPAPPLVVEGTEGKEGNVDGSVQRTGGYDTVLQTMGLCSTPEPTRLLRNMGAACKPDGQILLLEHGRSHYGWLNRYLDASAPGHADRFGCWWNKDIGKIVEESGLEVVRIRRYNFGTTWWVEARPGTGEGNRKRALEVEEGMRGRLEELVEKGKEDVKEVMQRPQKKWWEVWN